MSEGTQNQTADTTNVGNAQMSDTDKLFGNNVADEKKNNDDQKISDDTSKTTDESKKTDGEQKPEDKKAQESKEGDDKKKIYDDVVLPKDLPEGIQIDNELLDGVKGVAAKHNIPKEALQELVNAYSKRVIDSNKALENEWQEIEKGWIETAKNDKEIGGEHFDSNVKKAQRAIDMFGTPELKAFLDSSRAGNHPELIRVFVKIGEKISEGGPLIKGDNVTQIKAADVMFNEK